ncbi:MAG: TonB-dependent receptor plug domain-containing protein, partial [Dechloromonas sp.]|nr:TonB-dependent receptor plug domain-containing protein [Dechloromonas sp.]
MKSAHRFPGIALATAVASLGGGIAAADESIYFSELPVVASVSRLPQRLADAPTAVTVIDRDMIKASGVRDLNDVFRLVPGFQTYPHTTEPARVSYHGLNDEDYSPRVQVLIDGRSMYSPLFGNGVNWATIPVALDDIERIEVVRGTNSVSYGSNAFLGVINIITVDPALTRGLSVSVSHGSQNVRDQALRLGGQIGEVGDFRLTYRQLNDDALADRGDWIDNFRSRLVDFRADMALDER